MQLTSTPVRGHSPLISPSTSYAEAGFQMFFKILFSLPCKLHTG